MSERRTLERGAQAKDDKSKGVQNDGGDPTSRLLDAATSSGASVTASHPRAPAEPARPWSVEVSDAIAFLDRLPAASVDLLVTDPPYESLEKYRAIGTTTRLKRSKSSSNDWFTVFPNARFPELLRACHRVLKRNAHLYLFTDQETMFVVKPVAEEAGFKFWKPLVWDKRVIGMGYHYRSRYEFVLFFEKGKRKLANLSQADILEVKRVHNGYPGEKPARVAQILIEQSCDPGGLVVDPFCGSASVGVAALTCGRRFAGCDLLPEAVALATRNLERASELEPGSVESALPTSEGPTSEGPTSEGPTSDGPAPPDRARVRGGSQP